MGSSGSVRVSLNLAKETDATLVISEMGKAGCQPTLAQDHGSSYRTIENSRRLGCVASSRSTNHVVESIAQEPSSAPSPLVTPKEAVLPPSTAAPCTAAPPSPVASSHTPGPSELMPHLAAIMRQV